ncbi:MAG: hypothetical protein HY707_14415 [Ignavibacteriae bacterium]|nr:hypothetical protein [Ignavibacteriota bacterium]
MNEQNQSTTNKLILIAQIISVALIWVFVAGISVWIVNLLLLSLELHDVPGASVGISIVAIPVFLSLAGVLTYVFVGLQKENSRLSKTSEKT